MQPSMVSKDTVMQGCSYDSVGGPITVRQLPRPACPDDGVLVRVKATGVCRSDWHAWQGHDPVRLPHTPGHEYAGVIEAVGPDVAEWSVGDRVTAPFVLGCGRCEYCRQGDPQVCPDQQQPGFTYPGSFADVVMVPAASFNLVRLPVDLPFVAAAALGCRFATAYRAVRSRARLSAQESVAVIGCGGVGLSAIMIARALQAHIIAVDVSPAALRRAEMVGAHHSVLISPTTAPADIARAVRERVGDGVHVSIDATGSRATVEAAVASLRRRGRHVQVGLLFGDDTSASVPLDRVLAWELELLGSHGIAAADYVEMLNFVTTHDIRPSALVERVISLEQAGAAMESLVGGAHPGITVIELP